MSRLFKILSLSLLMTACGSAVDGDVEIVEGAAESDDLFSQESNVVVGSLNWKSSTLLTAGSAEAKNAKAVGYLSIPATGKRCTAWLIANDTILTNHHCINTAAQAVNAKVSFNYEDGVSYSSRIWYTCSNFVKAWSDVDAAVLKCTARNGVLPGAVYGTVGVGTVNAATGASLYVIHQNCDYYTSSGCSPTKKYSPGVVKNGSHSTLEISYDADTLGGSSGSPVFAATGTQAHKLIALHHVGLNGDAQGRGTANTGVKVLSLKSRLAEVGL